MQLVNLFFSALILTLFHTYLASKIIKQKLSYNNSKNIILILILNIINVLIFLNFTNFLKVILNFILVAIFYKFVFKESFIKSFLLSIVIFIYFFLADIIFGLLLLFFVDNVSQSFAGKLIVNLSIIAIILILYEITPFQRNLNKIISIHEKTKDNTILIMIIILMGMLAYKNFEFCNTYYEYFLNCAIIIIFWFVLFTLFKEREHINNLNLKYDHLFKYLNKYEKDLTEKNIIIHEFKNQIIAIRGFIHKNNKNALKYIESLTKEINPTSSHLLKDMEKIPAGGLKGLLYYKLSDLCDDGVDVCLNVDIYKSNHNFFNVNSDEYKEIIKVIGVYLDNAIEASVESVKKQILIEIVFRKNKMECIITNTYKTYIDETKLGKIGYSTKGKERGYGLNLANKIIKKNKIEFKREINKDFYTVYLTFNNKNNNKTSL